MFRLHYFSSKTSIVFNIEKDLSDDANDTSKITDIDKHHIFGKKSMDTLFAVSVAEFEHSFWKTCIHFSVYTFNSDSNIL